MRPSYFISDLHLSEKHPELTELLLRFYVLPPPGRRGRFIFWAICLILGGR